MRSFLVEQLLKRALTRKGQVWLLVLALGALEAVYPTAIPALVAALREIGAIPPVGG